MEEESECQLEQSAENASSIRRLLTIVYASTAGGDSMAICPHCGADVGFVRFFFTDHVTGECVKRRLDLATKRKPKEEEQ